MKKEYSLPKFGLYPFWFWNGEETEPEIRRQLALMRDAGCRGAAIHSREGNRIPYLSSRWMVLVRYAAFCAREMNLKLWIYDEDGYPSGNAGGEIQRRRPDLRQQFVDYRYDKTDPEDPAWLAFDAGTMIRLDESKVPAGAPALRFFRHVHAEHVDTLHPDTGKLFVSLVHERYAEAVGEFFGSVIEAIYTDDESFLVWNRAGFVWSDALETEYRNRYGRELTGDLPGLVENLPDSPEIRMRFHSLAQELFLDRFIQPQIDWCHRHGLFYTGHLCGDEGERTSSIHNYTSIQPYLARIDVPAIDDFLLDQNDQRYLHHLDNGDGRRVLNDSRRFQTLPPYKHASSIAHQFKQDRCSAEVLTFLKWSCPLEYQFRQLLFELGMGVNLLTPHAFYYTVGGLAKHDCPPSYFFQQPYWALSRTLFSVWTRIAELLARGQFSAKILLLDPVCDRTLMNGENFGVAGFRCRHARYGTSVAAIEQELGTVTLNLMRRHIGFDLTDETILCQRGECEAGTITLGAMVYDTVLVLSCVPMQAETAKLLARFTAGGGRTITVDTADFYQLYNPDAPVGEGCEELLLHQRRLPDGFVESYCLNLGKYAVSPCWNAPGESAWYDPVTDRIIHRGRNLPDGFILAPGEVIMRMEPEFNAPEQPFSRSRYAPTRASHAIRITSVRFDRENLISLPGAAALNVTLPSGATVSALYAERGVETCRVNGVLLDAPLPSHPAGSDFSGRAAANAFVTGGNRISFDGVVPERVWLAGNFITDGLRIFAPVAPPPHGDLTQVGYPYYWGSVEITGEFDGPAEFLICDCREGAELVLDGNTFAVTPGGKHRFVLPNCGKGRHQLQIRLYSPGGNLLAGERVASFGLFSCSTAKTQG